MPFDPDAYLAQNDTKKQSSGFDPDAYLSQSAPMGGGESAFRGAIDAASFGLGDEAGGHLEAIGSKIGLRGLGSPNLMDIRLETDDEDTQTYSEVQEGMRDQRRALDKQAQEQNPKSFLAGQVGGGIAASVAPIGALKMAASVPKLARGAQALARGAQGSTAASTAARVGALEGGAYGFGSSEAEELPEIALDTAKGAAFGAAGGMVVGKGLEKISDFAGTAKDVAKKILPDVTSMKRGFEEGAKQKTLSEGLIANVEKVYKGIKGALTEGRASKELQSEISDQVAEAKRMLNKKMIDMPEGQMSKQEMIVANKSIREMSDQEAILSALFEDGPNPVKKWISQKAATENPGNMPASQYEEILNMPAAARDIAKEFEPKKVGRGMKEEFKGVQETFMTSKGEAYGELQNKAGLEYQKQYTQPAIDKLTDAIKRVEGRETVSGGVSKVMKEAKKILEEAPGYEDMGLKTGPIRSAKATEHFKRLQLARELIDDSISLDPNKGRLSGNKVLLGVRSEINDALKKSPMKKEVDDLWSAGKEVESRFFGAIKFGKQGNIQIDSAKIANMMADTDAGGRFRDAIDTFEAFINRPELVTERSGGLLAKEGKNLVAKLRENLEIADNKRALSSFRWTPGPTSPAVQRMQSLMGGQKTLVEEAISAPTGFVTMMDEFRKEITERAGKKLDDFDEKERAALAKLWVLRKNAPDMTQAKFDSHYKMLFPNASRQEAIDKFLEQKGFIMGKISQKVEDNKLKVAVDSNEDGEASLALQLNISEGIQEAMRTGTAVEGVKPASIKFNGTKMIVVIDSDKDGESSLELTVDLMESVDEIKDLVL